MVSGIDKWYISLQSAFVFMVIASPIAYRFTSGLHDVPPKPLQHLILHGFIYMMIVRLMMGSSNDVPEFEDVPEGNGNESVNDVFDPNNFEQVGMYHNPQGFSEDYY